MVHVGHQCHSTHLAYLAQVGRVGPREIALEEVRHIVSNVMKGKGEEKLFGFEVAQLEE